VQGGAGGCRGVQGGAGGCRGVQGGAGGCRGVQGGAGGCRGVQGGAGGLQGGAGGCRGVQGGAGGCRGVQGGAGEWGGRGRRDVSPTKETATAQLATAVAASPEGRGWPPQPCGTQQWAQYPWLLLLLLLLIVLLLLEVVVCAGESYGTGLPKTCTAPWELALWALCSKAGA